MKLFFILFFLVSLNIKAYTQPSWKLVKEKSGIKVFAARLENSKFKSIRVQGVFDGTISKLISIVTNVSKAPEWVYKTRTAYILKQVNPYEFFYYTESSMPWPVSNRDAIIHFKINPDTAQHILRINAFSEPAFIEKKDGLVRIPYSNATWYVTSANSKLNIDYTFEVDPGGSLPAWLVNMLADRGPYESFKKLMTELRE
ncbi:MAG: START domain-containing protein [Ginsengibacter sp.]